MSLNILNVHNTIADSSMASSVHILQCDYLHLNTLPHVFTSERAEHVHISRQISSLDSHISQLISLRGALHHRLRQLHNLCLPIHTLPIEILSYIFQQLVDLVRDDRSGLFEWYQRCLAEAFILSSVSSHFRHVALGTPGLWKYIPLHMTSKQAIGRASSLLRHCIAVVPSTINVAVFDELGEEDARSAIDILFTPDATQKIRAFELSRSTHAPNLWIEQFKGSSFPILDTLEIKYSAMDLNFDLGTLKALTRLQISNHCLHSPIIVPESVQYLDIKYITLHVLASLFYLCPNLVGCIIFIRPNDLDDDLDDDSRFAGPLTLNHLKRLTIGAIDTDKTSSFMESLRLPSLEILKLHYFQGCRASTLISLCRNVSATLMCLVIDQTSGILEYDNLHQLCRIPFPKLRTLVYSSPDCEPFMRAIHTLAPPDDEHSSSKIRHLPALKTIKLYDSDTEPRALLDSLKEWRIGDAFYFHIKLNYCGRYHYRWSPELREELRSIVGDRRIEVTWGNSKV